MRSFLIRFVIGFALVGCTERSPLTTSPPISAYSYNREYANTKDREITESFKNFDDFARFVTRSRSLKIHEGLPHDVWENELYESELAKKETIDIDGSHYYATPASLPSETVDQLRLLSSSKSSFVPFRGYKPCGGFHPDWCLVWTDGIETYNMLLCFGCEEMIARKDGKRRLYCDMWNKRSFEQLLNPLHSNRPRKSK